METVNNVAAAAAKAVWGDSTATKENETKGQEPVSGKTGDTAKGEPYDAGNLEPSGATTSSTGTDAPSTGTKDSTAIDTKPAEFAKNTGTAAPSENTPDNPSTDLKAQDAPKDSSKGQEDVRSPDDPLTHPKSAPTDVNDQDNQEDGPNEAQKLDGPGPKPVEDVAREHGGDAGNLETKPAPGQDKTEKVEEGADKDKDLGQGDKYVKTSGLNADGGDFDATKPGAGREADRLMEAKGTKPVAAESSKSSDAPQSPDSSGKEKKSISQRIKDKLHKH